MNDDEIRKFIVATVLDRFPEVIGVYLFGSQATGPTRTDSDFDLALLCERPLNPDVSFDLKADLSSGLKADIDLVDLLRCDTVTAAQVVSTGLLLHSSNSFRCAWFETTALSKYALLNEERRGIVLDIQKSGRVYGR